VNLSAPTLDVSPSVRGALLQTLARLEQAVSRRQLAELAGVAPGNASGVIEELVRSGLVSEMVAGRSSMVALNRQHLAAGPVVALAGLRGELIRRLRARLTEWPDLVGAWLFGSAARGDADHDSDIDLLLIVDDLDTPALAERLAGLGSDVQAWTGNDLQVVEHDARSWQALVREGNPLVEQVRREGISLAPDASSLLARQR
jgi:predicted nucleotidyltransferase